MAKADFIEVEGIVEKVLPNAKFVVRLVTTEKTEKSSKVNKTDKTVIAHISGKLRTNFIRVAEGDKVTMEMSPYDLTQARITWRSK